MQPSPEKSNEGANKKVEREKAEILERIVEKESKRIARNYEREIQEMIERIKGQVKKYQKTKKKI